MVDLTPYPAMRDSGIPWLEGVPDHWEVQRGKALFRCIDIRSTTGDEELLTVSSDRGVVPRSSAKVTMFKAESYVGYKLCWPGDLVINSLWAWGRGLGVAKHHGIVSSAYGVYRLRQRYTEYADYFHELVRSTPFNWELRVRSKGIWISRLQLTDESFLDAPFPVPPPDEQAAIVRFLDHADRRIRRYVAAKRAMVALLHEAERVQIQSAAVSGLEGGAPRRPSGIRAIGDIPAHWSIKRLRFVLRPAGYKAGPFGSALITSRLQESGTVRVITPEHVAKGTFALPTDQFLPSSRVDEMAQFRVTARDIVFPIVGTLGRAMVVPDEAGPAIINQRLARLTPDERVVDAEFLCLLMSRVWMYQVLDRMESKGSILDHITKERILGRPLALPPIHEQRRILAYVKDVMRTTESAVTRVKQQVDLLGELSLRLTADVVTGKLDVHEAAAQLADTNGPFDRDEVVVEDGESEQETGLNAMPAEGEG